MARLLLAACALARLAGACGFLVPSGAPSGVRPAPPRRPPAAGGPGAAGRLAAAARAAGAAAAGAALGAAAALGTARRPRVARRVTVKEIEAIDVPDIPAEWMEEFSLDYAKDNKVIRRIQRELENTHFCMAVNTHGLSNATVNAAKDEIPLSVQFRSLRNDLVKKAIAQTHWEPLGATLFASMKYVFVRDEQDLKPTIKALLKMVKTTNRHEQIAEINQDLDGNQKMTVFSGGMLRDDPEIILPEDIPKLEKFPTKLELIAQVAGSVKQVPTKLAKGTKALGQKTAIGIKKIVEKMEEEGKATVGDAVA